MALSQLELPALQAGLSMPNEAAFSLVFNVAETSNLISTLGNVITGWNKAIFLPDDNDSKVAYSGTDYYKRVGIVYSLGSGIGVLAEYDVAATTIELSEACPANQVKEATNPATTDNWVTFSGCQTPFAVTAIDNANKKLTVKASRRDLIPFFSELQYVRALYAYVDSSDGTSPRLCLQDVTRGKEALIEGVSQVLFSFDDDSNVLTVHLLVRGNRKFPGQVTSSVTGWPGDISEKDRHYRLVAMSASWRVRN